MQSGGQALASRLPALPRFCIFCYTLGTAPGACLAFGHPTAAGRAPDPAAGEWSCPLCGTANDRFSERCGQCRTQKPQDLPLFGTAPGGQSNMPAKPGDWICADPGVRWVGFFRGTLASSLLPCWSGSLGVSLGPVLPCWTGYLGLPLGCLNAGPLFTGIILSALPQLAP
jgi:hypothetical protein